MNKFNIGDEVVYKVSGKIDNIMECAPGQILYQLENQNKDYWLKEEDLSFAEEIKEEGEMVKKSIKAYYYVDSFVHEKELEWNESCNITVEDGIVYIKVDDVLKLAVNKDHFISIERIEK